MASIKQNYSFFQPQRVSEVALSYRWAWQHNTVLPGMMRNFGMLVIAGAGRLCAEVTLKSNSAASQPSPQKQKCREEFTSYLEPRRHIEDLYVKSIHKTIPFLFGNYEVYI